MQEVGCVIVMGNVVDVRLLCICGLMVGFWWSVKFSWRMGILEQEDGTVVGVYWPLPSGLASDPLTLLALAATPLQQT